MRLVIETNILVSELLRKRGRDLIELSELELYLAEKMKNEAQYELQKRISIIVSPVKVSICIASWCVTLAGNEDHKLARQPHQQTQHPSTR